jgi:3-dehydroquinate dehydratase
MLRTRAAKLGLQIAERFRLERVLESSSLLLGHLSDIAQREHARKEIVIAGASRDRASGQGRNSRRAILIFSNLNS